MVGTGPVLSFTLTPGTQGGYTCQASVAGYTPVRKHTQVTTPYCIPLPSTQPPQSKRVKNGQFVPLFPIYKPPVTLAPGFMGAIN